MSNDQDNKAMDDKPDITGTEFGREVVNVMAYGCLQYMQDNNIPITCEGFQQLVQISAESGENGRIAFQEYQFTQLRLQQLFTAQTGIAPMKLVNGGLQRLKKKPSLRNRLLALGVGPDSQSLPDNEKAVIIETVKRHMGDQVGDVIDALIRGECRRDLVWSRIEEIKTEGNISDLINEYKERWNLVVEE